MFGFKTKNTKKIEELQQNLENVKDMARRYNENIQEQLPDEIASKEELYNIRSKTFVQTIAPIHDYENDAIKNDIVIDKEHNIIIQDEATEEYYKLKINTGYIFIEKIEQ